MRTVSIERKKGKKQDIKSDVRSTLTRDSFFVRMIDQIRDSERKRERESERVYVFVYEKDRV